MALITGSQLLAGIKKNPLSQVITALPTLERVLFHICNLIGNREEYRICLQGPDSFTLELFWGALKYRKGNCFTLSITCTKAAFPIIMKSVSKDLKAISYQVPNGRI